MSGYRTTEYFDERPRLRRDEWTLAFRPPEFAAFQLLLHDYQSAVVWLIVEARRTPERQAWDAERERLLRIYSTWRRFSSHYRGMSSASYVEATARACQVSATDVRRALALVDAHGLMPEVAA